MAAGEFRFGTASIYMAEAESFGRPVQVTNALLHGYKLRRVEAVFPGIPPIYSNGKSEARVSASPQQSSLLLRPGVIVALVKPAVSFVVVMAVSMTFCGNKNPGQQGS